MTKENKKLLQLCVSSLKNNTFDPKNRKMFSRDYDNFMKGALTFRELLESVRNPKGELREAMKAYYADSQYNRVFKGN